MIKPNRCQPNLQQSHLSREQEVKFDWLDRTFGHSATEWSDRDR